MFFLILHIFTKFKFIKLMQAPVGGGFKFRLEFLQSEGRLNKFGGAGERYFTSTFNNYNT